jgi:PKD repeat protein
MKTKTITAIMITLFLASVLSIVLASSVAKVSVRWNGFSIGASPTGQEEDTVPPVADAGPDQTVREGVPMSFNAEGSTDNVGIVSYEWDFGDENTGTGVTTTHIYTYEGTYTVTLTVRDAAGNSDTDSCTVTVYLLPAPVAAPVAPSPWPTTIVGVVVAVVIVVVMIIAVVVHSVKVGKKPASPN